MCIVICKKKLDFQLVISLYDVVYSNQVAQSELINSAKSFIICLLRPSTA